MASELTRAVYELLSADKPVTPAGAAYLLRHAFTPTVLSSEAEESLEWLARKGLARRQPDQGFGPEYLLVVVTP
jgi:hypothetical protein